MLEILAITGDAMHEKLACMSIHEQIKQQREKHGWSQQELARLISEKEGLKKPLSWQTVQQWENGASAPKRTRLPIVLAVLGLDVAPQANPPKAPPPPAPPPRFRDRREVSESDWALLQAVKVATTEADRKEILSRAKLLLEQAIQATAGAWKK